MFLSKHALSSITEKNAIANYISAKMYKDITQRMWKHPIDYHVSAVSMNP